MVFIHDFILYKLALEFTHLFVVYSLFVLINFCYEFLLKKEQIKK